MIRIPVTKLEITLLAALVTLATRVLLARRRQLRQHAAPDLPDRSQRPGYRPLRVLDDNDDYPPYGEHHNR